MLAPAAILLPACAAWQASQISLAELGLTEDDVLALERGGLETAHRDGARLDVASIDAVDRLVCTRMRRVPGTPICRYRIHYTKPNGERRSRSRYDRTFSRDEMGRWELGFIVRGP